MKCETGKSISQIVFRNPQQNCKNRIDEKYPVVQRGTMGYFFYKEENTGNEITVVLVKSREPAIITVIKNKLSVLQNSKNDSTDYIAIF